MKTVKPHQKNNAWSTLIFLIKEYGPAFLQAIGLLLAGIAMCFLHGVCENNQEDEEDPYADPKLHMNYRGEYCGKDKLNWY